MSRIVTTGRSSPHGSAGIRIDGRRPGGAEAAADDVRADDEETVRVDDLARPDQHFPPSGLAGDRIGIGDVLVARQRVADQDRVGARLVQASIGLVGDLERRERLAGIELQRLVRTEADDEARRLVHLGDRCADARGGHGPILPPTKKNRRCAMARPATIRNRPFSELFNVAASRPAKSPRRSTRLLSAPSLCVNFKALLEQAAFRHTRPLPTGLRS